MAGEGRVAEARELHEKAGQELGKSGADRSAKLAAAMQSIEKAEAAAAEEVSSTGAQGRSE
eukprot:754929-Hanusia_phi.AAC.2